jgi:iron complex transport system substrate-binding protein
MLQDIGFTRRAFFVAGAAGLIAAQVSCSTTADAGSTAAGRTVDTLLGDVTVPRDVGAVVVLEGRRDLDVVLSLGLPLVGYPAEEAGALDLVSPLAAALAKATTAFGAHTLFLHGEVDLEKVVAAAPDLIVSRIDEVQPIEAKLRAISSVVAIGDQTRSTWQHDLRLVGRATGTSTRASHAIARYERRVKTVSATYADVLRSRSFAPISIDAEALGIGPDRLLSTVLRDLGATPSSSFQKAIDAGVDGVDGGPEQLAQMLGDADAVVALVNDAAFWKTLPANPLWSGLDAVQKGHVVRSDKQTHEGGAITALFALDVIERLLKTF